MIERVRIGITQEAVAQTEEHVIMTTDTESLDSIASFTSAITIRMRGEQSELWSYVRRASQNARSRNGVLTFGYAAALTYDMIPEKMKRERLTTEQIDVAHQSIVESIAFEDQQGTAVTLQLSWFVDKLKTDSPAYMDWLGEMVNDLDQVEDKKDFILGSFLTIMPFFMKEDARILGTVIG